MKLDFAIDTVDKQISLSEFVVVKDAWKIIRKALEEAEKQSTPSTNTTKATIQPCSNIECGYHASKDYLNNCMLYYNDRLSFCPYYKAEK